MQCSSEPHIGLGLTCRVVLGCCMPSFLQVEVTDVATGKTWYFAAECWLDAAQGDGVTERLLLASDKDPWADRTAYKVRAWGCLPTSSKTHCPANYRPQEHTTKVSLLTTSLQSIADRT